MVTWSPGEPSVRGSGFWEITTPSGTVSEFASTTKGSKPSASRISVASRSLNPITLGTSTGPRETVSVTTWSGGTSVPLDGSTAMTWLRGASSSTRSTRHSRSTASRASFACRTGWPIRSGGHSTVSAPRLTTIVTVEPLGAADPPDLRDHRPRLDVVSFLPCPGGDHRARAVQPIERNALVWLHSAPLSIRSVQRLLGANGSSPAPRATAHSASSTRSTAHALPALALRLSSSRGRRARTSTSAHRDGGRDGGRVRLPAQPGRHLLAGQVALDVGAHLRSALIALIGPLGERLGDDRVDVGVESRLCCDGRSASSRTCW
jgi:hypothetical protein